MTSIAHKFMIMLWWVLALYYGFKTYYTPSNWSFWVTLLYISLAVGYMWSYDFRKRRGDFGKKKL